MIMFNDCTVINDIKSSNFNAHISKSFIEEYGIYLRSVEYISSGYYNENMLRILQYTFEPINRRYLFSLILKKYENITFSFIKDYFYEFKLNSSLIKHPLLLDDLILELDQKFYPIILSIRLFEEDFLMKMYESSNIELRYILSLQRVSENFILKYMDKFSSNDFTIISSNQILSENFILMHGDKLDWKYIVNYQKISTEIHKKYFYEIQRALNENKVAPKCANIQKKL